ncbi:hypothetical protein BJV78DRAFT_716543 [Lactifluus subvellereus]|nr:hypothetical protein BJV78DRAFT_716543 [Lactifluus subvellereus]
MLALLFLWLLLAATTFAAPSPRQNCCQVPASALSLPSNQSQLTSPTSAPSFVALAVGVQNYTCTPSNTFTSVGAVAELFDISCLNGQQQFSNIQKCAYDIWSNSSDTTISELITTLHDTLGLNVLGEHYFISNPDGSLNPKFDFTSSGSTAGNPNAFVVAAKVGDIPAPTGSDDVDWLELKNVSGELATEVFRVFTVKGKPPTSCTPGSQPTSKYTAQYWFFGGSF